MKTDQRIRNGERRMDSVVLSGGRRMATEEYLQLEPALRPPIVEAEARGIDGCAVAVDILGTAAGTAVGGLAGFGLARTFDSDSEDTAPGLFLDADGAKALGTFALGPVVGEVGGLVASSYADEPLCSQRVAAEFRSD